MKAKIATTKKHKPKPKLPKVAEIEEELIPAETTAEPEPALEPEPEPLPQPKTYTQEDWQKEVAQHVPPGQGIPDWLSAKAP